MRIPLFVSVCLTTVFAFPESSRAQVNLRDTFDTYTVGAWAPQGGWSEWTGSTDVNGRIDLAFAFTGTKSGMVVGNVGGFSGNGDDMVYDYANLPGGQPGTGVDGQYVVSIMTYVPSTATGTSWVILLNQYPTALNWSMQIQLQADNLIVHSAEPIGGVVDLPLIFDEWVAVVACIDLANDYMYVYYGEDLLTEGTWVDTGSSTIAALDIYGDEPASPGTTGNWFDNHRIEQVGSAGEPCVALNVRPSQVTAGTPVNIRTQSPTLASTPYALFAWEVNGSPFVLPILFGTLNALGQANIPATIPPGVSGISIGLRSLVAIPGGGVTRSNTFELVFQ